MLIQSRYIGINLLFNDIVKELVNQKIKLL
jgi:hypothetical protein